MLRHVCVSTAWYNVSFDVYTWRLQVWLQEFAWTEADKPVKLAARSAMVPDDPKLAKQPIFCFETMMNLLYWSCYVYGHKMVR